MSFRRWKPQAPAPIPPGSGRGFSYWGSVGQDDRINRRHVIIAAGLDADPIATLPDIAKFFIFALELL